MKTYLVCRDKQSRIALITKRTDQKTTAIVFFKGAHRRATFSNREFDREYKKTEYPPIVAAETWLNSTNKMTESVREELEMYVAIHRNKIVAKGDSIEELGELKDGTEIVSEESLEGKSMKYLVNTYNTTLAKDERVKCVPGAEGDINEAIAIVLDALAEYEIPVKPVKEKKEKKVKEPKDPNAPKKARINKEAVITLLVDKNPKRAGSKGAAAFDCYMDGMTVAEFVAAGGSIADVHWDLAHKFIEISE